MYPWFLVCVAHLAGMVPFMCNRHFVSRSDCLEALQSVNEFYIPVCQKGRLASSSDGFREDSSGFFAPSKPSNDGAKLANGDAMLADLFRVPGGSILCWYPVYKERDVPCH